jgi:hypothetical protein
LNLVERLMTGEPVLPGTVITVPAMLALAAADLLPVGLCKKDGWVPLDCPVLADGLIMRCPCCFWPFTSADVVFMDDPARRAHGLEVEVSDQDAPYDMGWAPTRITG